MRKRPGNKELLTFIFGIIIMAIGIIAYFSSADSTFNKKIYGIILIFLGVILIFNYIILNKKKKN